MLARSLVALAALASILSACDSNPPLAVADVDLARFQGKWYEIAKLPRPTESGCVGTTASYRLVSDGKLAVQSECQANGSPKRMIAEAVASDRTVPAKLSLDVGGFYGDYWILEVGKDYEYAVVGHPTRDYLWILSRTPALDSQVTSGILSRARANHFDVSRLEYTPQSTSAPASSSTDEAIPDPPEYGCSVVSRRRPAGAPWILLGLSMFVARRPRR